MRLFVLLAAALFYASHLFAAMKTETIEYRLGSEIYRGYLAYDDAKSGQRPGVLVVHEWKGLDDYAKRRTEQLAELGYVAFAVDVYGQGKVAASVDEAKALAGPFYQDRTMLRDRLKAGLEALLARPEVDAERIAAIGYCFGGMSALELARSGAMLDGVVSFHGSLKAANAENAKNIKARVLALHGGADPHVPPEDVTAFMKEMNDGGVNWQMVIYGKAVHGFTNPANGTDVTKGAAYDAEADARSWNAMKVFFDEIFR